MLTKVQKWGNSQGLRFPRHILEEVDIDVGDEVEMIVQDGAIIVRPATDVKGRYDLKDLVSKMPSRYEVTEEDWGVPVGKEAW